jgi:hypothetical protein
VAALVLAAALPARAELSVKIEAGSELDSNVHRTTTENGAEEAAAGARFALRALGSFRPTERSAARLSAVAAAKVFPSQEARNETVALVAADGRWDLAVGPLAPGLRLSYYDVTDADGDDGTDTLDHAFRTGAAAGALTLRTEDDHRLEVFAGGRFFQYKPDRDLDFTGVTLGAQLARRLRNEDATRELAYAAGYTFAERAYDGPALANICRPDEAIGPHCLAETRLSRADLFHALFAEITWTRAFILGARYELQLNDSNSFGQSLLRHRLELSGTTELFADIFLNAQVVLIVNQYLDALLLAGDVGTFITIEDEARNAVIVHLTRDLGRSLAVEARAALYTNPFADKALEYRRMTLYLGFVYDFGR